MGPGWAPIDLTSPGKTAQGLPYQILEFVNEFFCRVAARQRQFFVLRHYVVQAYVELGYLAGLGERSTRANWSMGCSANLGVGTL